LVPRRRHYFPAEALLQTACGQRIYWPHVPHLCPVFLFGTGGVLLMVALPLYLPFLHPNRTVYSQHILIMFLTPTRGLYRSLAREARSCPPSGVSQPPAARLVRHTYLPARQQSDPSTSRQRSFVKLSQTARKECTGMAEANQTTTRVHNPPPTSPPPVRACP